MSDLSGLTELIVAFREAREWRRFHTPKNLGLALSIEVGELQEHLLWRTEEEIEASLQDAGWTGEVRREIADILIYALLFCHETGIDPVDAITSKLAENARKYPVELARGNATKYTHLRPNRDR